MGKKEVCSMGKSTGKSVRKFLFPVLIVIVLLSLLAPLALAAGDQVGVVFPSLGSKLECVWGYNTTTRNWLLYEPSNLKVSDLMSLNAGSGYWLQVNADCVLFYGVHSYNLYKGWNLIGWLGSGTTPTPGATSTPTPTPTPVEVMQCITGDTFALGAPGSPSAAWYGQTFRCPAAVTIVGVKVKLTRAGDVGRIQFFIADTANGFPRFIISSTVIAATSYTSGSWVSLPLPAKLLAGKDYVVFYRMLDYQDTMGTSIGFGWRADNSDPVYASGNAIKSVDNGLTWTALTGTDMMFQVY